MGETLLLRNLQVQAVRRKLCILYYLNINIINYDKKSFFQKYNNLNKRRMLFLTDLLINLFSYFLPAFGFLVPGESKKNIGKKIV